MVVADRVAVEMMIDMDKMLLALESKAKDLYIRPSYFGMQFVEVNRFVSIILQTQDRVFVFVQMFPLHVL